MEVATEIMKGVVQVLMEPVKEHLRCMISYDKFVKDMHTKMDNLKASTDGVEGKKKQNVERCLEVPAEVGPWLDEVEKMNKEVADFPNDEVRGCLEIKSRYKLGRKAFKISKDIQSLLGRCPQILGTEPQIPLGRIDFTKASTSTPSSDHNDIPSRVQTKRKALEALGPSHKHHVVALWGMGGVGKTTMMKELKEVVEQKNMFKYIARVDIGEKPNLNAIQECIANYLGIKLEEQAKQARADKLRQGFAAKSEGGKNKFLIILDDVWQPLDLEDIGLSSLPNQGVDFNVLLTSRKKDVCSRMGVEADSVFNVRLLEEDEARSFFRQFVKDSDDADLDPALQEIGDDIVSRCQGLPIAIKTIGKNLKGQRKHVWEDARARLQHHDLDKVVMEVFEMSYKNLKDGETESIFLLCGLFPEDFNIPIDNLMRYGWGLKIFKHAYTIREARNRLKTCTDRLVDSNLLIKGDNFECVKMHDLVRAFVLNMFSKVEHASLVNHGSNPGWPEIDMGASSCKRISLTCEDMSEFPSDLNFPNLSILKLMHGEESLRFRQNFYGEMEKLQVISYDQMKYPLLPPSPHQCLSNLRVLLLHQCNLPSDLSSIGDMLNLEVLSFANSYIRSLPSTIGNLQKLRVLDLRGCYDICVDNSVFKNLVKLEELYACSLTISFTGDNCNDVAECWKNLSALEFKFSEYDVQLKNLSFENLERFKISMGRSLAEDPLFERKHSSENTLQLVAKKGEISGSRINKLLEKTAVLCLSVDDMNDLQDVGVKSFAFHNLRILVVLGCAELRYLFTPDVAKVLSNLEHLRVSDCCVMKELIHVEGGGEERVTFPKLKFISLSGLPELLGLCQNVNIIALPQLVELSINSIPNITSIYSKKKPATFCLLREEVLIPELEKLHIQDMDGLKEIWPCDFRTSNKEVKLRKLKVWNCSKLVNLFPGKPIPLLRHLEKLYVSNCDSIEVLFDIDLDCVGEIGEEERSSSLRKIDVYGSGQLREVWRIKGGENNSHPPIRGFQAVESLTISECKRFRNLFTPTTTNFHLGALTDLKISECGEVGRNSGMVESNLEQEINHPSEEEEEEEVSDGISYTPMFPSSVIHSFHNLRNLHLECNEGVEVVFEIESAPTSDQDNQHQILPYLQELNMIYMERISHVWKCNWNEFLILQDQQSESPFHNLTTIRMGECNSIKYLFSPLMAKLLSNLKEIFIKGGDGMEEVVSNRDDDDKEQTTSTHTSTTLFPHLHSLALQYLPNLKNYGGDGAKDVNNEISTTTTTAFHDQYKQFSPGDGVSWSLCQYPRVISIKECGALSSGIPCYAAGQMHKLQGLGIESCHGMKEVFETQGIGKSVIMLKLANLQALEISDCDLLEHIFTFRTLESLIQLEELKIEYCKAMKVIVVKEEEEEDGGEQTTRMASSSKAPVVVFPRLKSIELVDLPELEGFFLGTDIEFQWPSLDDLTIKDCPQMKAFAAGGSTAPQLKHVETRIAKYSPPECWFNSHMTTTTTRQHQESTSSWFPAATLEGINNCSFHNLIELHVEYDTSGKKAIVPSNELLHLQKLEKIRLENCHAVEEVFEALEVTNSTITGSDESPTTVVVTLPNLIEVKLMHLTGLKHMWKSNRWTSFEFPNLKKLSIHGCSDVEHVVTSSMVGNLKQLQEISISYCNDIKEVIVKDEHAVVEEKEEEESGQMNEVVLPRLKSLRLYELPHLKGFCMGKEDFSFPLLDTLTIERCPSITTFTTGNSSSPKLKGIQTGFGWFYVEEDINSFIKMKQEEFRKNRW